MKWKTFVIGWVFALAILLMAQRRSVVSENAVFRNIVDLTHSVSETTSSSKAHLQSTEAHEYFATHLDAPAHSLPGMWTVDQIPAERLVRPLVVLDVSDSARQNADYLVSIEDIAHHEQLHGAIPPAAVVVAYTGWSVRWNSEARISEFRQIRDRTLPWIFAGIRTLPGGSAASSGDRDRHAKR